mgnify:CR=1 FL=1
MKKYSSIFLALLFAFTQPGAQNTVGIPDIINYTKDKYNVGTQNRSIAQNRNGVLYFANYEGLLSFYGTYRKTYPLPNKNIVRTIAIGGLYGKNSRSPPTSIFLISCWRFPPEGKRQATRIFVRVQNDYQSN